jgi:hypothetical protein
VAATAAADATVWIVQYAKSTTNAHCSYFECPCAVEGIAGRADAVDTHCCTKPMVDEGFVDCKSRLGVHHQVLYTWESVLVFGLDCWY